MSQQDRQATRVVNLGGVSIGGSGGLVLMAGPCAVESKEQMEETARFMAQQGIPVLRGGAFKPRTSPYAFQGLGEPGLEILRTAANHHDLQVVSEVIDTAQLDLVMRYADLIQVGARGMTNTCLLKSLGASGRPVLLKRGFGSTLDEFLMAADYIQTAGGSEVLLCERGIRTFEYATRFTLDLSAVAVLKQRSPWPVVVDPSHAAGHADLVPSLAMAAVAAGADALLMETHPDPQRALCDSNQALDFRNLEALIPRLHRIWEVSRGEDRLPQRRESPGNTGEKAAQ